MDVEEQAPQQAEGAVKGPPLPAHASRELVQGHAALGTVSPSDL
jgi:hypothetical protein